MRIKKLISVGLLIFALASLQEPVCALSFRSVDRNTAIHPHPFYRTELYFGLSIPGGKLVSDDEWENFLEVVTVRFPRGFTVVDARGQYMQMDDEVIKEPSKILIILYPASERTASRRKIEEIRRAYVKQFKQESVLRLDYPAAVRVSF